MNRLLIIQSNCLIAMSFCVSIFAFGFDLHANMTYFMVAIALIVLLGVPHGAIDVLFASQTYGLVTYTSWIKFLIAYIAAAAGIVLAWLVMPNVFFIAFVMLSMIHFSDDLNMPGINLTKLTYGMSIIVMPSLFYSAELTNLYGMIIDLNVAQHLVTVCQFLVYPSALLLLIQLLFKKIALRTSIEIIAVLSVLIALPPLFSFTLYFCFMHSARHLIRSHFFLNQFTTQTFLKALTLPTATVMIIGAAIWLLTSTSSLETDLIRIIFIGLAALTIPHAWVLKKAKFLTSPHHF
jgi:Brp/Blh family beta-carotene 15,15'-monooxygenase